MMRKKMFLSLPLVLTVAFLVFSCSSSPRAQENEIVLDRPFSIERLENGNTLIADGGGKDWQTDLNDSEIIEVDAGGKIVWHFKEGLVFAHTAKRLENGDTLIVDTGNNRLLQVSPDKKIVWSSNNWPESLLSDGSTLNYPNDIEVLENGHFLVTDRNNDRIIEIDSQGTIFWQATGLARPHNADPLPNGNILFSDSENDQVLEINTKKQTVWSYGEKGGGRESPLYWPRDVDRLENGNLLVTDSKHHRIVEITKEGDGVWQYDYQLSFPYEADRLASSHTLICDSYHARVIEVNPKGEVVWEFRNAPDRQYPKQFRGGFEEDKDKDNWPDHWIGGNLLAEGQGNFEWDNNVFQDGQHSGKINAKGKGMIFWHQYLKIKPGQKYNLAGLIKSQDLRGLARFEVLFLDELGGQTALTVRTPNHTGSANWTRYEATFETPSNAIAADVWCLVQGEGTAWFDAIKIKSADWQRVFGLKVSAAIIGAGILITAILNKVIK